MPPTDGQYPKGPLISNVARGLPLGSGDNSSLGSGGHAVGEFASGGTIGAGAGQSVGQYGGGSLGAGPGQQVGGGSGHGASQQFHHKAKPSTLENWLDNLLDRSGKQDIEVESPDKTHLLHFNRQEIINAFQLIDANNAGKPNGHAIAQMDKDNFLNDVFESAKDHHGNVAEAYATKLRQLQADYELNANYPTKGGYSKPYPKQELMEYLELKEGSNHYTVKPEKQQAFDDFVKDAPKMDLTQGTARDAYAMLAHHHAEVTSSSHSGLNGNDQYADRRTDGLKHYGGNDGGPHDSSQDTWAPVVPKVHVPAPDPIAQGQISEGNAFTSMLTAKPHGKALVDDIAQKYLEAAATPDMLVTTNIDKSGKRMEQGVNYTERAAQTYLSDHAAENNTWRIETIGGHHATMNELQVRQFTAAVASEYVIDHGKMPDATELRDKVVERFNAIDQNALNHGYDYKDAYTREAGRLKEKILDNVGSLPDNMKPVLDPNDPAIIERMKDKSGVRSNSNDKRHQSSIDPSMLANANQDSTLLKGFAETHELKTERRLADAYVKKQEILTQKAHKHDGQDLAKYTAQNGVIADATVASWTKPAAAPSLPEKGASTAFAAALAAAGKEGKVFAQTGIAKNTSLSDMQISEKSLATLTPMSGPGQGSDRQI